MSATELIGQFAPEKWSSRDLRNYLRSTSKALRAFASEHPVLSGTELGVELVEIAGSLLRIAEQAELSDEFETEWHDE